MDKLCYKNGKLKTIDDDLYYPDRDDCIFCREEAEVVTPIQVKAALTGFELSDDCLDTLISGNWKLLTGHTAINQEYTLTRKDDVGVCSEGVWTFPNYKCGWSNDSNRVKVGNWRLYAYSDCSGDMYTYDYYIIPSVYLVEDGDFIELRCTIRFEGSDHQLGLGIGRIREDKSTFFDNNIKSDRCVETKTGVSIDIENSYGANWCNQLDDFSALVETWGSVTIEETLWV